MASMRPPAAGNTSKTGVRSACAAHRARGTRREPRQNSMSAVRRADPACVHMSPPAMLDTGAVTCNRRPMLFCRPVREVKVQQVQKLAIELCSLNFDCVDPSQRGALLRRTHVWMMSLADDVAYWDGDLKCKESGFGLLGLGDADSLSIRSAVREVSSLDLENLREHRCAYEKLCATKPLLLAACRSCTGDATSPSESGDSDAEVCSLSGYSTEASLCADSIPCKRLQELDTLATARCQLISTSKPGGSADKGQTVAADENLDRVNKRCKVIQHIKELDEYTGSASKRATTPNALDSMLAKREWEKQVREWRLHYTFGAGKLKKGKMQ